MTETDERAETIKDLAWTLQNALLRDAEMTQRCTWPDEWEAAQLLAKARRVVKAHMELRDAILSQPHRQVEDGWHSCAQAADEDDPEPGSACLDEDRAGGPCDCGRDARAERLLSIMAGIYDEPTQ